MSPIQNRVLISTRDSKIHLGIYSNPRHEFPYDDITGAHDINVSLAVHNPDIGMDNYVMQSKYYRHLKESNDVLLRFSDYEMHKDLQRAMRLFRVKGVDWNQIIITNEKQTPLLIHTNNDQSKITIIDRNAKKVLHYGISRYVDDDFFVLSPMHEKVVDIESKRDFHFNMGARHELWCKDNPNDEEVES